LCAIQIDVYYTDESPNAAKWLPSINFLKLVFLQLDSAGGFSVNSALVWRDRELASEWRVVLANKARVRHH